VLIPYNAHRHIEEHEEERNERAKKIKHNEMHICNTHIEDFPLRKILCKSSVLVGTIIMNNLFLIKLKILFYIKITKNINYFVFIYSSEMVVFCFVNDVLYEVPNDQNEKMLDHNTDRQMVFHRCVF
jgi:hypothetical protein